MDKRSYYISKLRDDKRNHAYELAIKATVHHMVKSPELNPSGDRFYRCCDLRTGAGLFAMMIARAFKNLNYRNFLVIAIEPSRQLGECAMEVVDANEMGKFIHVVPPDSPEYKGKFRFDLLVADVFDTDLLGRGCLTLYKQAIEQTCAPNCIYIPREANIYIQIICSDYLQSRNVIEDIQFNVDNQEELRLEVPERVRNCCGLPRVDDLRLGQIEDIQKLSNPLRVFQFKFDDPKTLELNETQEPKVKIIETVASLPMVCMWWDLILYDESLYSRYLNTIGKNEPLASQSSSSAYAYSMSFNSISCAPNWLRTWDKYPEHYYQNRDDLIAELYGPGAWRHQWTQAIYHFRNLQEAKNLVGLKKGSSFVLHAYHNSTSFWFDINPTIQGLNAPKSCTCGVHLALSRSEISFLNGDIKGEFDDMRKMLEATLGEAKNQTGRVDFARFKQNESGLICPLARGEPKWIINLWNNSTQDAHPNNIIDLSLQNRVCWKKLLNRVLDDEPIKPVANFSIMCSQIVFKNLTRLHGEVKDCRGFNFRYFDKMIQQPATPSTQSPIADDSVDSIFLWNHESDYIGSNKVVFSTTRDEDKLELKNTDCLKRAFKIATYLDGGQALVFWVRMRLIDGKLISTGPMGKVDDRIQWNRNYGQLVHFVRDNSQTNGLSYSRLEVAIELTRNGLKVATNEII